MTTDRDSVDMTLEDGLDEVYIADPYSLWLAFHGAEVCGNLIVRYPSWISLVDFLQITKKDCIHANDNEPVSFKVCSEMSLDLDDRQPWRVEGLPNLRSQEFDVSLFFSQAIFFGFVFVSYSRQRNQSH